MWRREGGKVVGVLNDWDLARDGRATGMIIAPLERIGTVPFMALDLLTRYGKTGHRYRHDQEALVWVLAWLFINYDKGHSLTSGMFVEVLRSWSTDDHQTCAAKKIWFLEITLFEEEAQDPKDIASETWRILWPLANSLLLNLSAMYSARRARLLQARITNGDPQAARKEPLDEEVYSNFWSTVRQAVNTANFRELSNNLQTACLEEGPSPPECPRHPFPIVLSDA